MTGRTLWAALSGVGAGILLMAAYVAARRAGIQIPVEMVVAAAGALAFAGAVAVFTLFALDKRASARVLTAPRLNEPQVKEFISFFREPEKLQILARPDMLIGEVLVRLGDAFKGAPDKMEKKVVLTLRGGKKAPFNTDVLKRVFATLAPFKLEHVLLLGDGDEFIGYIPGDRAKKDFSGPDADVKIGKCIIDVFAHPSEVTALRAMGGISRDDTIPETDDVRSAAAKLWANSAVQALVIHRHLKPVGVIDKFGVLSLTSTPRPDR